MDEAAGNGPEIKPLRLKFPEVVPEVTPEDCPPLPLAEPQEMAPAPQPPDLARQPAPQPDFPKAPDSRVVIGAAIAGAALVLLLLLK